MIQVFEEPVDVYSWGLCHLSCCAPKTFTKADVERDVNRLHPTCIPSQWEVIEDKFNTGQPNPYQCEEIESRQHWLLTC